MNAHQSDKINSSWALGSVYTGEVSSHVPESHNAGSESLCLLTHFRLITPMPIEKTGPHSDLSQLAKCRA